MRPALSPLCSFRTATLDDVSYSFRIDPRLEICIFSSLTLHWPGPSRIAGGSSNLDSTARNAYSYSYVWVIGGGTHFNRGAATDLKSSEVRDAVSP